GDDGSRDGRALTRRRRGRITSARAIERLTKPGRYSIGDRLYVQVGAGEPRTADDVRDKNGGEAAPLGHSGRPANRKPRYSDSVKPVRLKGLFMLNSWCRRTSARV